MRDIFAFKEVDAAEKAKIRRYLRQKLRRFERLLRSSDADEAQLRVTVRAPRRAEAPWEVRGVLRLSTGTLVSEAESRERVEPALDELADELLRRPPALPPVRTAGPPGGTRPAASGRGASGGAGSFPGRRRHRRVDPGGARAPGAAP